MSIRDRRPYRRSSVTRAHGGAERPAWASGLAFRSDCNHYDGYRQGGLTAAVRTTTKRRLKVPHRFARKFLRIDKVSSRRNIAAYFFAFLSSESSSQVLGVAVGWTVYSIHHRPFDLGLVGLVMFAPQLFLVFIAGACRRPLQPQAHRDDRRDGGRGLRVRTRRARLAHVDNLPLVLSVLFCQGIARAFGSPAERYDPGEHRRDRRLHARAGDLRIGP